MIGVPKSRPDDSGHGDGTPSPGKKLSSANQRAFASLPCLSRASPLGKSREAKSKGHRSAFSSLSTGSVFSTSAFSSQARRAVRTPYFM